ncbi:hypothetical protein DKY64_01270 [Stenotrophomonas maltophilia]|jgi:hypothetical protein|nr:hypothetical protein DKY64_01270 [Stenotrophomonas maltophilia]
MRIVTVPFDAEALERLDFDESLPGDLEELQLTDKLFDSLVDSGVLDSLNATLGVMIDMYEDESIEGLPQLLLALQILTEAYYRTKLEVIRKIMHLCRHAIERNTGLFFYL